MHVAVLGASNKQNRYSYKAVLMLNEHGHVVYPVHPGLKTIEDIPVYPSLSHIPETADTISVYLSKKNQKTIENDILKSGARRVIFNPGAENPELTEQLQNSGIEPLNACTLVLLSTGQF